MRMISCLALFLSLAITGSAFSHDKPNVIIIFADDFGYGDLKAFNSEARTETPHLDQLAKEGTCFTDAHSCGSVCVPSRYALITGQYPFRMRSHKWREEALTAPDQVTLPKLMKKNGYQTACVGKWHLGFDEGNIVPISPVLNGGPVDRGFDSYFGIPGSLDQPPYYYIRNRKVGDPPTVKVEGNNSVELGWTPVQGAFWRTGNISPGLKHEAVLPDLTSEVVGWLNDYGKRTKEGDEEKPFFIYFPMTAPHTPWLPLEKFAGKSSVGLYGDFMMQVDNSVGQVLGTLEKNGLDENTLVIFTSDNGPMWYEQDAKKYDHRSAGPFRGMKGDSWEGGHRVPMIVRWPGHVPEGKYSDALHCHADFLATCTAVAGGTVPENAVLDSQNMLSVWKGEKVSDPVRNVFISESSGRVHAIRKGDWKLIPSLGSGGFTKPSFRKPEAGEPVGQLYNLKEDPGESRNLYAQYPEKVKSLKGELDRIKNSK